MNCQSVGVCKMPVPNSSSVPGPPECQFYRQNLKYYLPTEELMKTMISMIKHVKLPHGSPLPVMPSWLKCSVLHLLDLDLEHGMDVLVDKESRKKILCRETLHSVVMNEHVKCGHGDLEATICRLQVKYHYVPNKAVIECLQRCTVCYPQDQVEQGPYIRCLSDAVRRISMPSSIPVTHQIGPHMLTAPRPPSKPITSYLRFSKKIWEKVKVDRPNAPVWETSQIIGQMWRDLTDEEKSVYVAEYEADKEEYKKAFEVYRVALADYQEAVGAAQQIAENNRLLLEAEQAAQLYVHQVPYINMPVRMKPEPVEHTPPQMPYVQQLEQVIGTQSVLRPPGPGSLYVPQNVQVLNYNSERPPQISQPHPQPSTAQKDQPQTTEPKEKKSDENFEDRIDVDSIKGIFGWATIDGVNVPYIVRKHKKYVAVRIVEKKLLSRYPNSFPDELGKKEPLVSYFVTENEAKLLDEINQIHCSYEYGHQPFSCKDLIVDMAEFEDFYNLVKKTFPDDYLAKLRGEMPPQQLQVLQPQASNEEKPANHVKSELAKVCGWVQINNTVSPYIRRYTGKYVPLSVIKYAAGLLTDLQIDGTLPTLAECNLLNETCKAAGFDFTFGQNTKVIHLSEVTQRCQVNILELPFNDPLKHAQYLDLPSPTKTQQSPSNTVSNPMSGGQRSSSNIPAPNVNPFSGYPTAPPNPFFNMMPIMPQRYPQQSMGQYPMPPQGQRFPFLPPQNMPNSRPNMGSPPRQSLPSPGQMSTSQHSQFPTTGQSSLSQSNPLSMMSQMAQNGHPLQSVYHGSLPPGAMGSMNPMIRPGHPTTTQAPGMSPQGPVQGMRMPMTAPLEIMPRGPMLHTAQMPQLSPSQSTISRFPNPHSMVSSQQLNNNQIVNKPANTPNAPFPSSSPAPVPSSPKTAPNPSPVPVTNGEATTPQRPSSNQSSVQSRSNSRSPLVDKISGVVLNGKSISCMHLEESERPGKFCLVEAVCKLYFSQSSMNEFLYALQNVLNIPLYPCTEDEEKAFIQYYNLPVSVLKCNKMIGLSDLEKYFPQMSYMFNQCDTPNEATGDTQTDTNTDKSTTASPGPTGTQNIMASPIAADGHPDSNQSGGGQKRPSLGPAAAPPAKQPCRRLEEMVQKLKQSQTSGDGGDKQEEPADTDTKPVELPVALPDPEDSCRKGDVIVLD